MNLQSTDFELFGLPKRFAQEREVMDARWRALQCEAHPDRFAAQGAAAQRVALQWSVRINEAYQRLKDPLKRAAYLCELHGAPVNAQDNTAMPADFLLRQLAWREALEEATDPAAIEALHAEVLAEKEHASSALGRLLDEQGDHHAAAAQLRALMFIERFAANVQARRRLLGQ